MASQLLVTAFCFLNYASKGGSPATKDSHTSAALPIYLFLFLLLDLVQLEQSSAFPLL